jgi:hypothetical protein
MPLILVHLQWHNIQFSNGITSANLELLQKIQNEGAQAFGIFYNALMHSFNIRMAELLRPLIDDNDIFLIDGEIFYKYTMYIF